MRRPVGLDDQPMAVAEEVGDVGSDWNLSPELQVSQPAMAKQLPQYPLVDRRFMTHGLGEAGQALSRQGIEACRELGAAAIVLLGHPAYYPRFGFSTEAAQRLISPYAGSPAFMALELVPGALAEPLTVAFPAAFG